MVGATTGQTLGDEGHSRHKLTTERPARTQDIAVRSESLEG